MAATSSPSSPLRTATYRTLIGLLAATGMRVGEATRLDRPDFDPAAGALTSRDTKFGKSRLVPLHPTATGRARRLPAAEPPAAPRPQRPGRTHMPGRDQAGLLQRPRHLAAAGAPGRAGAPLTELPSPPARPAPLLRGRRGCLARPACHIPWARQPGRHLLVPVGRPGTAGRGRAAARRPPGAAAVTPLAPPCRRSSPTG
jgi:hypothetical protein